MFDALAETVDTKASICSAPENYAGESTRTIPDHSAGRGVPGGEVPVAGLARAMAGADPAARRARVGRLDRQRRRAPHRDFVAQREWRPVAPQVPWLDAAAACESLGATGDCHGAKSWRATWPPTRPRFKRGRVRHGRTRSPTAVIGRWRSISRRARAGAGTRARSRRATKACARSERSPDMPTTGSSRFGPRCARARRIRRTCSRRAWS